MYFLCNFAAYIFFSLVCRRLIRKAGLDLLFANVFAACFVLGMYGFSHVFHFIVINGSLSNDYIAGVYTFFAGHPDQVFTAQGMLRVFHATGGLWNGPLFIFMLLLAFMIFFRIQKESKGRLLDIFVMVFPFTMVLVKAGCLANGCCHGLEGDGALFLKFSWVAKNMSCYMKSCFPTQLLDMVLYLLTGTVLVLPLMRKKFRGRLLLPFVMLMAAARFLSGLTRVDNVTGKAGPLRIEEWLLLATFAGAVVLLAVPRLYSRLLKWRETMEMPDGPTPPLSPADEARVRRSNLILFVFLLLAATGIPALLFIPLFIVLFTVALVRAVRSGRDRVLRHRALTYFIFLMAGLLLVTAYFVVPLTVFLVLSLVFISGVVLLVNRYLTGNILRT